MRATSSPYTRTSWFRLARVAICVAIGVSLAASDLSTQTPQTRKTNAKTSRLAALASHESRAPHSEPAPEGARYHPRKRVRQRSPPARAEPRFSRE
jgi:hypothetical protein